jgi:hypothetical protein
MLQAEGAEKREPAPGEPPMETETGCNKYMYFVCSGLGQPVTQLADVSLAQIVAARGVNKLLTGNLDAPLNSHPPYPGMERNFLRAQIARISHATTLCPKGYFVAPEEGEGTAEVNEEYQPLPTAAMHDAASWAHLCAATSGPSAWMIAPCCVLMQDMIKFQGSLIVHCTVWGSLAMGHVPRLQGSAHQGCGRDSSARARR